MPYSDLWWDTKGFRRNAIEERGVSAELESLWQQQTIEYQEIRSLEERLVIARARHLELCEKISALAESEAVSSRGSPASGTAPGSEAISRSESGGGFSLTALTERGKEALPRLWKLLEDKA